MTQRRIPYEEVADFVSNYPRINGYGPALAKQYGIKLSAAHRWIHETRRRGFLPPGNADRPCYACDGTGVQRWRS